MATQSLGQRVASFKARRDQSRDKHAFLARCNEKYQTYQVAGLELVGLGGSCGKPALLLPFVVRFDEDKLTSFEALAERFDMYVEYGAYPHLKSKDGDKEIAAIQDWTNCTLLFIRPSYDAKDELVEAIQKALR
jgi:hypothetical protein